MADATKRLDSHKKETSRLDSKETEKLNSQFKKTFPTSFKEGDIADYFYVIEEGQVEIIKHNPDGTETILAVLKEGESFVLLFFCRPS